MPGDTSPAADRQGRARPARKPRRTARRPVLDDLEVVEEEAVHARGHQAGRDVIGQQVLHLRIAQVHPGFVGISFIRADLRLGIGTARDETRRAGPIGAVMLAGPQVEIAQHPRAVRLERGDLRSGEPACVRVGVHVEQGKGARRAIEISQLRRASVKGGPALRRRLRRRLRGAAAGSAKHRGKPSELQMSESNHRPTLPNVIG